MQLSSPSSCVLCRCRPGEGRDLARQLVHGAVPFAAQIRGTVKTLGGLPSPSKSDCGIVTAPSWGAEFQGSRQHSRQGSSAIAEARDPAQSRHGNRIPVYVCVVDQMVTPFATVTTALTLNTHWEPGSAPQALPRTHSILQPPLRCGHHPLFDWKWPARFCIVPTCL